MRLPLAGITLLLVLPLCLPAQGGVHVLVVTGLSAELASAKRFAESAIPIVEAAKAKWGVVDSNLYYLAEDPKASSLITGTSTRAAIEAAFQQITRRASPGDLVLVALIGHGSGERDDSKVNITGPDPTARDYAAMLEPLARQRVVFIVGASGSGDFLATLSGKERVIITATKSALERNESIFSVWMAKGLTDEAADTDKDGMVSVMEAFTFARTQLEKVYIDTKRMQTEHPQLDDNGDKKGSDEPDASATGADGALAARVTFGGAGAANPKVAALMAERRVLEQAVDELKAKKSFMLPADYDKELERLLFAIADKTAAIRALDPVRRP